MKKLLLILLLIGFLSSSYGSFFSCSQVVVSEPIIIDQYYGFLIPALPQHSYQDQTDIAQVINQCLGQGVTVYWLMEEIICDTTNLTDNADQKQQTIPKGSYLIQAPNHLDLLHTYIANLSYLAFFDNIPIYYLKEPLEHIHVITLQYPRIVYHDGDNVIYRSYKRIARQSGFDEGVEVGWKEIPEMLNTNSFDVFIWGGHYGTFLDVFLGQLNIQAFNAIRNFIREGGGYIGSCYGGYEITTLTPPPLRQLLIRFPKIPSLFFLAMSTRVPIQALPGYGGKINITIVDTDSPLTFGLPTHINDCDYVQGPMFLGKTGSTQTIAIIESVDQNDWWYENQLEDYPWVISLREKWINTAIGKPIWVTTEFGDGLVVAFGDHPEFHDNYPRIVHNALYLAANQNKQTVSVTTAASRFSLLEHQDTLFRGSEDTPLMFYLEHTESFHHITWMFDQENRNTSNPCYHSYSHSGNYEVLVTTLNQDRNLNISMFPVQISEPLSCNIQYPSEPIYTMKNLTYHAEISGGFVPYLFQWNIKEEVTSTNKTLYYTFIEPGVYLLEFTVTDDIGSQDTYSKMLEVINSSEPVNDEPATSSNKNGMLLSIIIESIVLILVVLFFLFKNGKILKL